MYHLVLQSLSRSLYKLLLKHYPEQEKGILEQMLRQKLKDKIVCVIGLNSVLTKIFIKQMIELNVLTQQLFIVQLRTEQNKIQKFKKDPYFGLKGIQWITQYIQFIGLNQLENKLKKVDLLFNFFIPLDFSQFDKAIQYHIVNTNAICKQLSKIEISKSIIVSSIYCQVPGFVCESEESQQYIASVPFGLNKETLDQFIKDNFSSTRQCWQWSIKMIEKEYQKVSQSIQIVRVPSLGPTLNGFEGYLDRFNYFTYFVYLIGTGFFLSINGNPKYIADLIPSDYVVNYMIVLGSLCRENKRYRVHNLCSSSRNPVSIQKLLAFISEGWEEYENKSFRLKITQTVIQKQVERLKQQLPIKAKNRLSQILDIKKWKIQSQQANMALQKKMQLAKKYEYFLSHEWICQSNFSIDLNNSMDQQQQKLLPFNVNSIDWKVYAKLCCYSIKKYLLNHQVEDFHSHSMDLLAKKPSTSYFSDIIWAVTEGKVVKSVNLFQIKNYILSTKSVKEAIKTLVEQRMLKLQNDPISYEKAQEQLYKTADQMCLQMFSQYNMRSIRVFAWFLHKVFKTIYQKVVVDAQALMKLRNHNQKELGPLIIIPTHRSYIDFLIMGYVFFGYNVKLPHIAAAQDFLNMAIVHILLRQSGAFFIKRNQQKNKQLYKAIMEEYITKTLADSHYLEFFIEGTRCRVGKMLPPKFGILSIVAKNVIEGKIADAQILPVTLNYEKVLQGQSFTYQMMGESKVKESLTRLIKAVDTLKENYGRIYIEFCPMLSVRRFFNQSSKPYNQTLEDLGYKITYSLSENLIITAPAILATVVLMHRKGISDDSLSEQVLWLCKEIASRGIKIARSQSDHSISISNTLTLLSDIVQKSKKNMFQVQVSLEQQSFVKLFTMTYYRNTLTHIFWEEAIVLLALISFGHQKIINNNVKLEDLFTEVKFLYSLLVKEYVLKGSLKNKQRYEEVLSFMQSKKIIRIQADTITFDLQGQPHTNYFNFYGSLIWPVVESYWITCLYLFKLKNQRPIPTEKLLTEIQWFGQSLINQRIINHLQSISMDTIKNSLEAFVMMKIIKKFNNQYKDGTKVSSVVLDVEENVLKNVEEKIETFLKKSFAKSIKGILESGQSSVKLDFPFLSRL